MADDCLALEGELQEQLEAQREALTGVEEAIRELGGDDVASAAGAEELLQVRTDLQTAVAELESSLLALKKERLFASLAAPQGGHEAAAAGEGAAEAAAAGIQLTAAGSGEAREARQAVGAQLAPGSACRFRYIDGRWYLGRVMGPGRQGGTLSVSFEIPTRPFMLNTVEVMEGLVRPMDGFSAAGSCGKLALGRPALAQLPGSQLYVGVEVAAVNEAAGTASVLPLDPHYHHHHHHQAQQQQQQGKSCPVVVPLARVVRHAYVHAGSGGGSGGGVGDWGEGVSEEEEEEESEVWDDVLAGGGISRSSDGSSSGSDSEDSYGLDGEEEGRGSESEAGSEDAIEDMLADEAGEEGGLEARAGLGRAGRKRRRSSSRTSGEGPGGEDDGDGEQEGDGEDGEGGRSRRRRRRGPAGIDMFEHARAAAAAGALSDTAALADWEAHSRGVASRLLVRMGYVAGKGLGARGEGALEAPEVLLLPERKGLGAVDPSRVRKVGGSSKGRLLGPDGKRRKRAGAREQRKRAVATAREAAAEAREQEEGGPGGGGLFDFINASLGDSSVAARIRKAQVAIAGAGDGETAAGHGGGGGGGGKSRTAGAAAMAGAVAAAAAGRGARPPPGRQGLMSHHDTVAGIQTRLARLHEMLSRNKADKGLRTQIEAQIRASQAELAAAQSAAAKAGKAIHDKDREKKWMKF